MEAGIAYSLSVFIPVIFSVILVLVAGFLGEEFLASELYLYLAFLLPQASILLAVIIFFRRTRAPLRAVYRPAKWYFYPVALLLSFGLFALSGLNELFLSIFEQFGFQSPEVSIPDLDGWMLLPAILVIAVLPAFFEETLHRGICRLGFENSGFGPLATMLLSGLFFSLFHGNPVQTVYQFVCGCAFALLAIRSGSVFPSMLAHFTNNAVVLILTACGVEYFPTWAAVAAWFALIGVCVFLFCGIKTEKREPLDRRSSFFKGASVGIVICILEWVTVFLSGWGLLS